jgi:nitroimidazol reductase NimA-like FMN-containing flavoprotein (pyridoxamine 5'-phosphate oxidase superfamily)
MNDDQKQAAADRLAKAREERYKKNPPKYAQYSKEVVSLPDDHDFSMVNVRAWSKEAKAHKQAEHR